MDLAKLLVRLELQSAQMLTELEKANKKIERFASQTHKTLQKWSSGLLAFFSARAILQWSKDVVKAQGDLVAMAEIANTSVENLSSLGYAAEQSASSMEALNKGLAALANTAANAAKGSKDAKAAFKTLGIEVLDGNGKLKDSSVLLLEVADSFAQYENGAAKSALAQDLMSKAGKELIPLLNRSAVGIKELQAEADRLGITVGTDAANAANTLSDNMAKLSKTAGGLTGQVLAPLVGALNEMLEKLVQGAQGQRDFSDASTVLVTALKLMVSAGLIVGEVFDRVGDTLGAAAAAMVAFIQKDFRRAFDIIVKGNQDHATSVAETAKQIAAIWTANGNAIVASAKATDEQVKKTLAFGGDDSGLEEIKITLEKIEPTAMEDFYSELNNLTATSAEKAKTAYAEQLQAVKELREYEKISAEEYAVRLEAINKSLEDGLGITQRQEEAAARLKKVTEEGKAVYEATRTPLEKYNAELTKLSILKAQGAIDTDTLNRAIAQSKEAYEKATDGAAAFYAEAKENAQDILGQGIYDALKDGFDRGAGAALDTFADMLLRMATEALAADIMGYLFGSSDPNTGNSTGGLLQAGLAYFSGGGRAGEGAVNPGVSYTVGENGPERFVPQVAGRIEDERRWGGGMKNNIYVAIEAPKGSVSRQTQMQTGSTIAKQIGHANKRNN